MASYHVEQYYDEDAKESKKSKKSSKNTSKTSREIYKSKKAEKKEEIIENMKTYHASIISKVPQPISEKEKDENEFRKSFGYKES